MNASLNPLISVAMPVFNSVKTTYAAVCSVLLQTYANWELILIDDGSTDGTLEICKGFVDKRIRLFADGKREGHGPRLNQAIDISMGKYIARMDHDDICFPQRFERQVEFLENNPEVDLLGTGALMFTDDGSVKGLLPVRQTHIDICHRPWSGFYLPHPTWMGKVEWFKKYRYDHNYLRAEDQELLLRSYGESKFACLPDILLGYRQNELHIHKILPGRRSYTRAVIREALKKKKYGMIPLAIMGQTVMGIYEALFLSVGLNPPVNHRALPLFSKDIIIEWRRCLDACLKQPENGHD
jgi:glycosyltransferase involved in cell wall biosynthesis